MKILEKLKKAFTGGGDPGSEEGLEASRRSFLKKTGLGAGVLGVFAFSPAAGLNVRSDSLSFYGADSTVDFEARESLVDVNTDLDVGGNSVRTSSFEVTENSSTNSLDFNYTG